MKTRLLVLFGLAVLVAAVAASRADGARNCIGFARFPAAQRLVACQYYVESHGALWGYFEASASGFGAVRDTGQEAFEAVYRGQARVSIEALVNRVAPLVRGDRGRVSVRHQEITVDSVQIEGARALLKTRETWFVYWERPDASVVAHIYELQQRHSVTMRRIHPHVWVVVAITPAYQLQT